MREQAIDAAIHITPFKHKKEAPFTPGDRIPYAGRVFDEKEIAALVDSCSWISGLPPARMRKNSRRTFAQFLGVQILLADQFRFIGKSACLHGADVAEARRQKNQEAATRSITVAAGFPTTVAPIIQYGAVPVFVDVTLADIQYRLHTLENALSDKDKSGHGGPYTRQSL